MPESFQNSTDSNQSGIRLFVFNPFHIGIILGNHAGIYSAFTEADFSNHNWSRAAWNSNYVLCSDPTQQKSSIKPFINGTNQQYDTNLKHTVFLCALSSSDYKSYVLFWYVSATWTIDDPKTKLLSSSTRHFAYSNLKHWESLWEVQEPKQHIWNE